MIRFSIVVAALYAVCCALAFGQTVPVPPDASARGPAESRVMPRLPEVTPAEPEKENLSGSLVEPNASYASVSIMAAPKKQPRMLKQHDLVTIIVREESQASSTGTTDLKRNTDLDAKIDSFVKLNLSKLSLDAKNPTIAPEVKGEFQRNFKGEAQVDRTDTLTARIGAEILDVKPNGTLVLQAHKHIKTDDEEQEFILTGTCRAEDVGPDNTVLSNILNDLDVKKSTKGAARDTTKRGGLSRLLDFLNPF